MLELKHLQLAFGGDRLFEGIEAFVGQRERIGLIGPNGAGKSTLFKLITGDMKPDAGQLDWQRGQTFGMLSQELDFPEAMPLMDYIKTALVDVNQIEDNISQLEEKLAACDEADWELQTQLAQDLHHWQERKRIVGSNKLEAQAEKIAEGLGYRTTEFANPLSSFSGGWKMRAELARLLLLKPDLLLLDEPTNHLDIYSIIWLESWLTSYEGSVIFISHDAQFLENVASRIWELEHRKLYDFNGKYHAYLEHKADTMEKRMSAALNQEKRLKQMQRTVDRFRAKASKARMAQSLEKMIQKEEIIEVERASDKSMQIRWPEFHTGGSRTATLKNINHSYNSQDIIINNAHVEVERHERIGFVGKNGTGKSTLAKILIGQLKPSAGQVEIGYKVEPYYFDQYASDRLDHKLTVLETVEMAGSGLTSGELRNLLGSFMFSGEDVHKKVKVLSGGEKNRLALALVILSKSNFLILDEPTNHLDMRSREVLRDALLNYPGTLVVVSHDRTFLTGLTGRTYYFDYGRITNYLGDINYVLEREEVESMRALEMNEKAPVDKPVEVEKSKEKKNKQYNLRKQLKSVEQKIVRLEEKKVAIETDMAFPDFYEQTDAQETIATYDQIKIKLEALHVEWERLADQVD